MRTSETRPRAHPESDAMRAPVLASLLLLAAAPAQAQRPTLGAAARPFVAIDTPVVAITHVRVIDGTGAPARPDQTLVMTDGRIAALGPAASLSVPAGALVIDGAGKTVIPGLVMVHEHLFYPPGPRAARCTPSAAPTTRADWWPTGRTWAPRRSRPTCTSRGRSSRPPPWRPISAGSRSRVTSVR